MSVKVQSHPAGNYPKEYTKRPTQSTIVATSAQPHTYMLNSAEARTKLSLWTTSIKLSGSTLHAYAIFADVFVAFPRTYLGQSSASNVVGVLDEVCKGIMEGQRVCDFVRGPSRGMERAEELRNETTRP
jgi:hypothetical protein